MDERTHLLPARGLVTALISLALLAGCRGLSLVPSGSLSQSSSATNPADMGETIPKHVITADYFGSIYSNPRLRGSKKVPPSEAAKFLDWGDVVPADQQTTADAGMKTLFYYRPTFQGRGDPFYKSDQFAHSCSGHRIAIYKRDGGGHPMYLMSRSPKQAGLAADYIKQVLQQNPFDMVFEDDAGFAPYQLGIHPCNLQASEWIARDARLEKEVHAKQLPSSLNAFTEDDRHVWTQNQQSLELALHHEGGLMEQCYSSNSNPQVYFISDTLWAAQENTEIALMGGNKLFFCYVRNYSPAKAQIAERIYDYASFLLSYRPQFAVLWETYNTPSNFHVLPESGFVALHPVKAQPTDISQLKSGGVYVREYADCYYRGKRLGPCAAIVNPSSSTATGNPLYGKYKHTLVLSGGGVADGGTVKFTGPTAPKSVQRDHAYVAL